MERISSTNGIIKGKENVVILKAIKSGTFKNIQLLARASYLLDTSIALRCSDFVLEKIEATTDAEALSQITFSDYEPYIEPKTIPINLNGNSIAKVGKIKDILKIGVDGSVSITKKISDKFALTSSLGWSMYTLGDGQLGFAFQQKGMYIPETAKEASVLCNMLKSSTPSEIWANDISGIALLNGVATATMRLKIKGNPYTTIAEFKAFLDTVDMYVYYRLAEEYYETINLPSIKPIELFEGTNVFELVTNLGTTLSVTYNYVTPSPSINRPSEIKTPVGKQSVVVGNKNLAKMRLATFDFTTGEITEGGNTNYVSNKIRVDNRPIYFWLDSVAKTMNRLAYDKNNNFIGNLGAFSNYIPSNITNFDTSKISYLILVAGVTTDLSNLVVNYSSTDSEYIAHQSQVQDLDVGELLGTIVDKEDGSYFENRYGKYIFNGSETITEENGYRIKVSLPFAHKINWNEANKMSNLSNYFKCLPWNIFLNTNGLSIHPYENMVHIKSEKFTSISDVQTFLQNNSLELYYELATPTYTKLTDEQQAQWNKIKKMHTYEGVTNIYTINDNGISPVINLEYTTKYAEEYDFYIDENARFIVPEYGINYQVSMTESDLSDMPEASESAVKIAGKDGDVVLNTTYEPKDFNIVAYTDDNLEPKDKEAEKTKLVNFLHSIKNRTKNFGLLYREKFYPVKYNDKLTPTIYPKSIRFEIPIKSSKSLGYALEKKMIFGNGKEISNTIEETGCKIIIDGPIYGTNDSPMVITLNDYQMAYYNTVLEGNRLEIDTNNSTIKHISSNGEITNVAAYYNHEYPKIKYGENEIKILSKIDSETQVYTEWYDLKI